MERYLLILCSRKLKTSLKGENINGLLFNTEDNHTCIHCNESSFYSAITSTQRRFVACFYIDVSELNQGQTPSHEQPLCHWHDVSNSVIDEGIGDGSLLFCLLKHLDQQNKTGDAERKESRTIEDPIDLLHKLADDLPQPGSYLLELIIVSDADEKISPESCISLYGFLERLQLWHQAKINFFDLNGLLQRDQDCESKSVFDSWKDVIEFGAIASKGRSIILRQDVLWSGDLLLRNENGCHTGVAGFEVRFDDDCNPMWMEREKYSDDVSRLLLSDEIEVLKVLEDYDIPLHVYCPGKLKLYLFEENAGMALAEGGHRAVTPAHSHQAPHRHFKF